MVWDWFYWMVSARIHRREFVTISARMTCQRQSESLAFNS
jgi:hypothetical protein